MPVVAVFTQLHLYGMVLLYGSGLYDNFHEDEMEYSVMWFQKKTVGFRSHIMSTRLLTHLLGPCDQATMSIHEMTHPLLNLII